MMDELRLRARHHNDTDGAPLGRRARRLIARAERRAGRASVVAGLAEAVAEAVERDAALARGEVPERAPSDS